MSLNSSALLGTGRRLPRCSVGGSVPPSAGVLVNSAKRLLTLAAALMHHFSVRQGNEHRHKDSPKEVLQLRCKRRRLARWNTPTFFQIHDVEPRCTGEENDSDRTDDSGRDRCRLNFSYT